MREVQVVYKEESIISAGYFTLSKSEGSNVLIPYVYL